MKAAPVPRGREFELKGLPLKLTHVRTTRNGDPEDSWIVTHNFIGQVG